MANENKSLLSRETLTKAFKAAVIAKKKADATKSTTERVVREIVATGISTGASAVAGGINARFGVLTLPGGIPADAAVGAAAMLAGLFELAGPASHHLCAAGSGFLGAAGYRLGWSVGEKARQRAIAEAMAQAPAAIEEAEAPAELPAPVAAPSMPIGVERETVAAR